jgi:hypothetical protein
MRPDNAVKYSRFWQYQAVVALDVSKTCGFTVMLITVAARLPLSHGPVDNVACHAKNTFIFTGESP